MDGSASIAGLDHLVFAVRSLDVAARRFSHLGFRLTPKGGHPALGSANHTFVFPEGNYGELLTAGKDGPFTGYYRAYAAAQEGLAGIAFRVADAEEARAALTAEGLSPEEILHFARPVEVDGRPREARFSVIQLPLGSLPGGRVFFTQHHTPDLVWRPEMLDHPNGVRGIAGVILVSDDPDSAAADYARIGLGLEIMSPEAYADLFKEPARPDRFAGVRFRVSDPDRAATALTVGGVRFVEGRDGIEVPASEAFGARLVFQR